MNSIEINDNTNPFIKSVRTLSLGKEKRWIKSMVKHDKIYMGKYLTTLEKKKAFLRSMFKFIDALNAHRGIEWDMHIEKSRLIGGSKYRLIPILHYKKFTISNSQGNSRELRDLIVAIKLHCGDVVPKTDEETGEQVEYMVLYPSVPYGTKLTYKADEYRSNYVHSHLGSKTVYRDNVMEMSEFCVGNGEIVDLEQEMYHNFDPNIFSLYLFMVDTLVTWESIEGTPYMYMDNITGRSNNNNRVSFTPVLYADVFQELKFEFIHKGFKPTMLLHNNRFKIKQDNYLEDFVRNMLITKRRHEVLVKKVDGNYRSYVESNDSPVTEQQVMGGNSIPYTIISGERVYFKMINENNQGEDRIETYRVHPKFLDYVTEKFEIALLKASIRDNHVERENRLVDTRQGA